MKKTFILITLSPLLLTACLVNPTSQATPPSSSNKTEILKPSATSKQDIQYTNTYDPTKQTRSYQPLIENNNSESILQVDPFDGLSKTKMNETIQKSTNSTTKTNTKQPLSATERLGNFTRTTVQPQTLDELNTQVHNSETVFPITMTQIQKNTSPKTTTTQINSSLNSQNKL